MKTFTYTYTNQETMDREKHTQKKKTHEDVKNQHHLNVHCEKEGHLRGRISGEIERTHSFVFFLRGELFEVVVSWCPLGSNCFFCFVLDCKLRIGGGFPFAKRKNL